MRRELARGGLLSAAAAVLVAAALFAADGSSDSRLFWIGGGAIVVVGAVGADVLFGRRAAVSLSGPGAAFLVLLAALALWQAGSIVWSIQPSRSWAYANRGLVYFAFACLGVLLGGVPARRLAAGTAALIGALLVWAVTAKVVPALYSDYGRLARLRYPIGYWNELSLIADAAVPLGLWLAGRSGHGRRVRAAGTLLLYTALVVVVLTYSRVGLVLAVLAAAAWLVIDRERLEALGPLAAAWIAGAVVAGVALLLPGVAEDGELHSVRVHDGLIFGAVFLAGAVAVTAVMHTLLGREADLARRRRIARALAVALSAILLGALLAAVVRAGGPAAFVTDRWHEFSNTPNAQVANTPGRVANFSSSNRWRWWQEAWNAFTDEPGWGNGAGTFGLTDRLERDTPLAVVEPHSTPLQFLSETGLIGFLLYAGTIGAAAVAIARRELNGATVALALVLGLGVLHSLVDIDWDYVAVQGPFFLLAGALVSAPGSPERRRPLLAAASVACALTVLYSIFAPWLAERRVSDAYDAVAALDVGGARDAAKSAHKLNPLAVESLWLWAASESALGDHGQALALYRDARDREPKNPETWFRLGQFEFLILKRPRDAYRDLNRSYTLDNFGPVGTKGGLLDQVRCKIDPSTCR